MFLIPGRGWSRQWDIVFPCACRFQIRNDEMNSRPFIVVVVVAWETNGEVKSSNRRAVMMFVGEPVWLIYRVCVAILLDLAGMRSYEAHQITQRRERKKECIQMSSAMVTWSVAIAPMSGSAGDYACIRGQSPDDGPRRYEVLWYASDESSEERHPNVLRCRSPWSVAIASIISVRLRQRRRRRKKMHWSSTDHSARRPIGDEKKSEMTRLFSLALKRRRMRSGMRCSLAFSAKEGVKHESSITLHFFKELFIRSSLKKKTLLRTLEALKFLNINVIVKFFKNPRKFFINM